MLPQRYRLIDTQGRVWQSIEKSGQKGFRGPTGQVIPNSSPPAPPPDDFAYNERSDHILQLVPTAISAASPDGTVELTPDELARVRFSKAIFTTESDWRTLEVPFEFHDLPLPPR